MDAPARRYVVVDLATQLVVNAVVWDGAAGWSPPLGCAAWPSETAEVGDAWTGSGGSTA